MRRRHALLAVIALALPLLAVSPSVAEQSALTPVATTPSPEPVVAEQSSTWIADGLYLVSYSGDLWRVDSENDQAYAITYEEWVESGFEAYKPAPTDYVRYPWSSSLYAVTFFGPDRDQWLWEHMTYEQWSRAGRPAARAAGWIEGTYFYSWATGPNIYVVDDGDVVHSLSWGEYVAAGQPSYDRFDGGYYQLSWDSSRAVIFIPIQAGGAHPSDVNAFAVGTGRQVSFAEWDAVGRPTPRVVGRLSNDTGATGLVGGYSGGRLMYQARSYVKSITYAEWSAMGFPPAQAGCTSAKPCEAGSGPGAFPRIGLPPYYAWQ